MIEQNIRKYQALIQTVKCGNFTKASVKLNCTQSAVSKMIAELESQLSLNLLSRQKNKVELTADGLAIYNDIEQLCKSYEQLETKVNNLKKIVTGKIRIATFSSMATYFLPKVIKEFENIHPNVEFEILLGDYLEIENNLKARRVDIAFTHYPSSCSKNIIGKFDDEQVVILPNKDEFSKIGKFKISDLEKYPFMLLEKNGIAEVSNFIKDNKLNVNIKYETIDDYAVMSMVQEGLGISILPKIMVEKTQFNIVYKSLEKKLYRTILICSLDDDKLSKASIEFIKLIKGQLENPKYKV